MVETSARFLESKTQGWMSRKKWKGGVHYIDFGNNRSDIFLWIMENSSIKNIRIKKAKVYRGYNSKFVKINGQNNHIDNGAYIYKIFFKTAEDFIGFKLTLL